MAERKDGKQDPEEARKARLAAALRANLHRRKAQSRGRRDAPDDENKTGAEDE